MTHTVTVRTAESSMCFILFKFKKMCVLYDQCFGSVVCVKKAPFPHFLCIKRPFFTVNILSYRLLFVMACCMTVHLEKQQKPHHIITSAVFNNRNQLLYIRDWCLSLLSEYKLCHKKALSSYRVHWSSTFYFKTYLPGHTPY